MRTLISIIFLISSISLWAQNEKNQTDAQGRKQGYWEKKYTNGKMCYQGTFKDNKPVGEMKRFHPNGIQSALLFFRPDGVVEAKLYSEQGRLQGTGNYIENKKDGLWNYFINDTSLASTENYKKGLKQGLSVKYWPGRIRYEEINYENDVKNGKWRQFHKNGRTKLETQYVNGKLQGAYILYSEAGQIDTKGQYKDNLMDGVWQMKDRSGKPFEIKYKSGVPENADELDKKQHAILMQMEKNKGQFAEPDETNIMGSGKINNQPPPQEFKNAPKKKYKKKKRRKRH